MGVLCLKHLLKHSVHLTLCNRTHANAQKILDDLGVHHVELLDFSLLQENIYKYDIVLSAVAGGAILTQDMLLMNLKQGHGLNKNIQKKIFFDLSIPRNFSFDTNSLKDSGIYNLEVIGVDDLKIKAQQHIHLREESAREAMGIVGKFTLDFSHWLSSLGVDPLIKTMRTQAKQASLKEINRAIKKGFIPEALRDNVTKLAHSIFNEFLHAPTIKLKSMAEDENSDAILESIANLFGTQDRILLNRYKCEYDNETK
ncbi:hypothetical protein CQA53_01295 [Helicobacter didelphidarum]|uniref:Glutamyl-tRNA reductase n=2 Tax=Helicobacter didelphidarum TaxID=2040648 RepID=A0A3D8IS11_9HELI|nr:hypothetical protein CQA53_01295 [Helicobacter didelphidarum]